MFTLFTVQGYSMAFKTESTQAGAHRAMLLAALALLVASLLTGCGALALMRGDPRPVKPDWQSLTLVAAPDANSNSALAVDVVLVRDKAMLDTLAAMPAARYFAARADLQRTFPEALTVLSVEITPGQALQLDAQRYAGQRIWAAFAFANYANPGDHRERLLPGSGAYVLQLNAQGFAASDMKTGAAR